MLDITAERFGRLTVVKFSHRSSKIPHWLCRCDCGGEKTASIYNLQTGKTRSCGCLQKERAGRARFKHGMTNHPAYHSWASMNNRCNNPNAGDFDYYGARGIRICAQWRTFDGFWNDMGATWAPGLSIDRIDNDKDYTRDNCRWATRVEQIANRRNSWTIDTPLGPMNAAVAARKADLPYSLLVQRVRAGWPTSDLFLPRQRRLKG